MESNEENVQKQSARSTKQALKRKRQQDPVKARRESDLARISRYETNRQKKEEKKRRRAGQPLSRRRVSFLSFLIPFLFLMVAYAIQGVWPVYDTTPLTIDLYHQYAPFLEELRYKLLNGESLFYSWHGGLGMNFYALISYYLASPLNILMILFPPVFLSEAVTVLTLIKIGLTGLTFSVMLREVYSPNGLRQVAGDEPAGVQYTSQTGTDWAVILFSTAFAVSGFMLAYSWDIMWLDTIVMLPLVVTGLYRLIRDGRFVMYTVSLALAIIFNYYIALMVCLFIAFYYFALYISVRADLVQAQLAPAKHFIKRTLQFGGASLLAAGVSAFMSVPTWLALQITSATDDRMPSSWKLSFNMFEFVARHLVDMEPKIRSGLPNVYAGLIVFILVPVYVFARNIRMGEKLAHLAVLAFLFMSFNTNVLNFIWHGMHYPNQLPHRFAFVYSFVLVIVCYRAISDIRSVTAAQIGMGAMAGVIYTVMAEQMLPDEVDHETALISIFFLILLGAAFSVFKNRRHTFRTAVQVLTVVMLAELLVNTAVTITTINLNEHYTRRSTFNGDFTEVRDELERIEEEEGPDSFYRTELIQQKTTNSPALYSYKGFTIFSSTSYEGTAKLMRSLGYHGNNINSYKYMSSTAPLNSIFGIEYLIDKEKAIVDPLLEQLRVEGTLHSYRNPYALGPGFAVSDNIRNWDVIGGTPFSRQDDFLAKAAGLDSVFEPLGQITESAVNVGVPTGSARYGYAYMPPELDQEGEITIVIENTDSRHVYFHVDTTASMQVEATVTNPSSSGEGDPATFRDSRGINKPEIFDVGYVAAGQEVRIRITFKANDGGRFKISSAALIEDAYIDAMDTLRRGNLEVESYTSRRITGTVDAASPGLIFFSIPYDKAWKVWVDGEIVATEAIGGGLLAAQVPAGSHSVDLAFTPDGFWPGILVTLGSLLVLGAALMLWRSFESRREDEERRAHEYLAARERAAVEAYWSREAHPIRPHTPEGRMPEADSGWQSPRDSHPADTASAAADEDVDHSGTPEPGSESPLPEDEDHKPSVAEAKTEENSDI